MLLKERFPEMHRREERGMALVIVLAFIVILTLVLVAFVSKSTLDSNASASFSSGVNASMLANDAANTIVAGLRSEIASNSTLSQNAGIFFYAPLSGTGILPKLDQDATANTAAGVPNLLMSSRSTTGNFPGDLASLVSNVPTATPSLNGRYLPASRWNDPLLLTASQNTQSLSGVNSSPNWVYVDRNGPVKLSDWSAALATPQQNGLLNLQYVIGRFAYRVYDISGLLDMNAAGYLSAWQGSPGTGRKGTEAMADFYDLGDSDARAMGFKPSSSGGPDILNWRGPATASYTSGSATWISGTSAYDIYVNEFAQKYGFMIVPSQSFTNSDTGNVMTFSGVNRFLDRYDLITLCNSGSFASEFTDPADNQAQFLSQVTAFSREVNAPTWAPVSAPVASTAAMNPNIPAILVTGSFTRRDGSKAVPGEPLVKTRFPLSKIALLSNPVQNAAAIQQYFGLQWDASKDEWQYLNADGSVRTVPDSGMLNVKGAATERLHTLQEIAALNREPDFFELLQAGIQADSLGQGANDASASNSAKITYFPSSWKDQNIARHILQIGVNIIDQYRPFDPVNGPDPTVIERTPLSGLLSSKPDPEISGVNNVPYIQLLNRTYFRRFDTPVQSKDGNGNPVTTYPALTSFYQFQLWNPHQNAAAMPSGEKFRIVAQGGVQITVWNVADKGSGQIGITGNPVTYNPSVDWIQFTLQSDGNNKNFSQPFMLTANAANITTGTASANPYTYTHNKAQVLGFCEGIATAAYSGFVQTAASASDSQLSAYERFGARRNNVGSGYPPTAHVDTENTPHTTEYTGYLSTEISNPASEGLSFQLQKLDKNGKWLPLQTIPTIIAGDKAQIFVDMASVLFETDANGTLSGSPGSDSYETDNNPVWVDNYCIFPDPRTTRFGFFLGSVDSTQNVVNTLPPDPGPNLDFQGWLATNNGGAGAVGVEVAIPALQLYQNKPGSTAYYTDRGQKVTRTGDSPALSPYTNAKARPVMLNRPFHSVAEMGYAFSDLPWKSLNFSQDDATSTSNSPKPTADQALLDLFSLTESPVRAGVINLNTASQQALTALLLGTNLNPTVSASTQVPAPDTLAQISATDASGLAVDIRNYLGNRGSQSHVIRTAADIATMIQALPTASTWTKFKREAVIAALADVHNARTWNVLIDVVAQAGRLSPGGGSLSAFQVTGQKHLIMEVAIDRYTGQIVDRLIEQPSEENPLQ